MNHGITMKQTQKMIKHAIYVALAGLLAAALLSMPALALDQIIRPYQSVRSSGMGGVRLTTGLYDENFFGNPARVMANPKWKVQLPDPMFETTPGTLSAVSDIIGADDDILAQVGDKAGTNLHGRVQMTFPSIYIPFENAKMGFAFGLITSTQFDFDLRRSFRIEPQAVTDVGPALTVGRRFLDEDRLAVGVTSHVTYRVASQDGFSFVDLLQGKSLSPLQSGGDGAHLDFDVGATYKLPVQLLEFDLTPGFAINNLLGGRYKNLKLSLLDNGRLPPAQPRTYGFGIAASRESLWKFTDVTVAFEVTDIGNNPNGSLFRLIHIGGEARYGVLLPRLGINQGYLSAGLGLDLKIFTLDFATYGEELSLNSGGLQDRRIALRIGFQI